MTKTRLVAATLCLLMPLAGCGRGYVLPMGDGLSRHSPPTVEGRIIDLTPDQLTLEAGDREVVIRIQPTTKVFRIAGGTVFQEELGIGQRVQVWYEDRRGGGNSPALAAVLMVASLDPGDER